MIEFNIVRPDLGELVSTPNPDYTYCDILNTVKQVDIFYYRYDRKYAADQIANLEYPDCLKTLESYIGRHFNQVTTSGIIDTAQTWVAELKKKAQPGLPVCVYIPSWKLYCIPLEAFKELQAQNVTLLLDECYEAFVDHLYPYFSWLALCGVKDVSNVKIISGRFNGHPRLKQSQIQWQDLDLEPIGVKVLSFPYFWFRSVELYRDYEHRPINFDRSAGSVMCMNNLLRQHRVLTLTRLLHTGTLDRINWSALDPNYEVVLDLDRNHKEFDLEQLGADTWLTPGLLEKFKSLLPKYLDTVKGTDHDSLVDRTTVELHDQNLANLVTETVYGTGAFDPYGANALPQFSDNYYADYTTRNVHRRYGFITEKTYKAIVTGQMFLIVGAANSLTNLRQLGFKTFGQYVDESYDYNINDDQRYIKVCDAVKTLSMSRLQVNDDSNLKELLNYNKEHFFDRSVLTEHAYDLLEFLRATITETNY